MADNPMSKLASGEAGPTIPFCAKCGQPTGQGNKHQCTAIADTEPKLVPSGASAPANPEVPFKLK